MNFGQIMERQLIAKDGYVYYYCIDMETAKPKLSTLILNIIEGVSDGILLQNGSGEILFFNDVFLEMTQWNSHHLLFHQDEIVKQLGLDRLNGEEAGSRMVKFKGSTAHFEVSRSMIESPHGNYYLVSLKPAQNTKGHEAYRFSYEQLFNNVGDPMFTGDLNGRITSANPAFYNVFGYDEMEEELLPNLNEMYVYRDELDDKIRLLIENGAIYNVETHLYAKDGRIRRVLDTSWVIRNSRGKIKGYASQFKDVTYLRNIENRLHISERNFTLLFDTILSSIILLDENGTILNLNSSAEKVYKYSWEEMVGQHYDSLLRISENDLLFAQLSPLIEENEGKYIESEVMRRRKDDEIIYTYAAYTAIRDGQNRVIAYSLVEKDLTERIHLEKKLRDSFEALKETQSAAIFGFAKLTEYRDKDTGRHLERMREFTRLLAVALRGYPQYKDYITDEYLEDLTLSSVLHDVGKVGIEDKVLLKPARLSQDEFDNIKQHVILGGEALDVVDKKLKRKSFLTMGKEIARHHHERWDGTGYPEGLKGEEIPLSARIVAIADVYDALVSKRPYKDAYSHEKAVEIIKDGRGSQFDPTIVDVFLEKHHLFENVRKFIDFENHPDSIADILGDLKM